MGEPIYGQEEFATGNSIENAMAFMVEQLMSRMNTCTPVKVVAVHSNGRSGVVGTVDVTPLVNQRTVTGESIEHTTIFGVPFIRMQGGSAAFIVDPQEGDLGVCIFASRDISSFKDTGDASVPPTARQYDMADGIYIGGWNMKTAPQRFVVVDDAGIQIEAGATAGTLLEHAVTRTSSGGTWGQTFNTVQVTAGVYEVTVPEFHVIGNLHVDGIVHCEWQGTNIGVKYGGTGADLSSTGGPTMVVAQLTPGAPFSVVSISSLAPGIEYTNITPTPSSVGGIPAGSIFISQTMQQMWDALLHGTFGGGTSVVVLGDTFATNQPYSLVAGSAQKITSLDASCPLIDGITLESGILGNTVPVLNYQTAEATTPLSPPGSNGAVLYLSQTGTLTDVIPTAAAGDVWFAPVARRITGTTIIYSPQIPIKIS